jgi:hypothetical protein
VHDHILGVTLSQLIPLLTAEHVEVEVVKLGEIELGGLHRGLECRELGYFLLVTAGQHDERRTDQRESEHVNGSHDLASYHRAPAVPPI